MMGILSIFVVVGLVAGVSYALFSSQASNTGNTFGAGTLTLNVIPGLTPTPGPAFTVSGAKPGDSFTQVLNLTNTGSINATSVKLLSIGLTPSPTPPPNLGSQLNLELWNDVNDNGVKDGGDTQIGLTKPLTDAQWTNLSLGFGILAAGHHKVIAILTFDSTADNTYQGLSASFDFNFQADQ